MARVRRLVPLVATLVVTAVGAGCAAEPTPSQSSSPAPPSVTASPSAPPSSSPTAAEPPSAAPTRPEPRRSFLTIPRLGLRDYPVIRYRGSPDDAEGTRLQNDGSLASPRGATGGTVPGEIGNYIVTGHRLSAGGPLRYLPDVSRGDHVLVTANGQVYDYRITGTMIISFRSEASKARQTAAVPGHPGRRPTKPMITVSTCATLEDHAAGNFWSDENGNPEHRIDKVGVLESVSPLR